MIYNGACNSLSDIGTVLDRAVGTLSPLLDGFDFIATSGISGVVVTVPLALQLGKPVTIVRKADDANGHHRGGEIIGVGYEGERYIIVDDFISSGWTVRHIRTALECVTASDMFFVPDPCVFTGFYSYDDRVFIPNDVNACPVECFAGFTKPGPIVCYNKTPIEDCWPLKAA